MVTAIPEQVWRLYLRADKDRAAVLRASAAWMAAPVPVQAIAGAS